jgi:hypothetical protein
MLIKKGIKGVFKMTKKICFTMIVSTLFLLLTIGCKFNVDKSDDEELPKVPNISVKINSLSSISVSWEPDFNASGYEVECYDYLNVLIKSSMVQSVSYCLFTELTKNCVYSFRARGYKDNKYTDWSGYTKCTLNEESAPFKIEYTNSTSSGVTLIWPARTNVTSYYIEYNDTIGGYGGTIDCGNSTSYTFTNLSQNVQYKYTVLWPSGKNDGMYIIGDTLSLMTIGGPTYISTPMNLITTSGGYSIKVSWDTVPGAKEYYVTIYNSSYKIIQTNKTASSSITFYSLSGSSTFYFAVRAYGTNGYYSKSSAMRKGVTF